jgi:hypothetical protein
MRLVPLAALLAWNAAAQAGEIEGRRERRRLALHKEFVACRAKGTRMM